MGLAGGGGCAGTCFSLQPARSAASREAVNKREEAVDAPRGIMVWPRQKNLGHTSRCVVSRQTGSAPPSGRRRPIGAQGGGWLRREPPKKRAANKNRGIQQIQHLLLYANIRIYL
jgi:hypothetical protein